MTTIHNIIFAINTKESIAVELPVSLTDMNPCDDVAIKLCIENNEYILTKDCFLFLMRGLQHDLQMALKGTLLLPASIKEDIGYLWNQYLHGDETLECFEKEGQSFWIGEPFSLWSIKGFTTWLYNDTNGAIILEITPTYKWHFDPAGSNESYDEFMTHYKPEFTRIIPRTIAHQWAEQLHEIMTRPCERNLI